MSSYPTHQATISQRLRGFVLIAAVMLIAGLVTSLPSMVNSTEASWTDTEHTTGEVSSGTVPPAQLTTACRYRPGLLGVGARVEIYWAAPSGYTVADAEIHASTSGLGSILAPLTGFNLSANTTGGPSGYTTEVPTNLLGGLLGLGTELEVSIVMTNQNWLSEPASIATNAGLIGGIGGNCRNLT